MNTVAKSIPLLPLSALAAILTLALLSGCVSSEGDRRTATLTSEEPFASLLDKRVTLLRPMRIQEPPDYMGGFGASPASSSDDIAWVAAVSEIPGKSKPGENIDKVRTLATGRTLPAGTVIQLKKFYFVKDYAVAWLPGQDTSLPWYPGRGFGAHPTNFYVQFTSTATSALGRPFGTEVVLAYRWGCGPQLWAAPWEPKDRAPVFVGDLGQSFKQPH